MLLRSFTILCLLLSSYYSWGCFCVGPNTFCEAMEHSNATIIRGIKTAQLEEGMEIQVLNVVQGSESNSKVIIWGGNGANCLALTENIPSGEVFVFVLEKIQVVNNSFPEDWKADDYLLSDCGINYISCETRINRFTLEEEDLDACPLSNPCQCGEENVIAFPNPTTGPIQFQLNASEQIESGQVNIYSYAGQLMRAYEVANNEQVNLMGLQPGIYLIEYQNQHFCDDRIIRKVLLK